MKVFLDMDGVLTNFFKGVCLKFEKEYDYHSLREYNFWNPWNITREQVDAVCNSNFWANLEPMHDAFEIFDAVSNKFPDKDIYFLTAPMPNIGSWSGKVQWIRWHFNTFEKRLIITQAPKSLFAKSDTLLIDDNDENVAEFVAAGGQAILVPRPWNELHGWADISLQIVKQSLDELKT